MLGRIAWGCCKHAVPNRGGKGQQVPDGKLQLARASCQLPVLLPARSPKVAANPSESLTESSRLARPCCQVMTWLPVLFSEVAARPACP